MNLVSISIHDRSSDFSFFIVRHTEIILCPSLKLSFIINGQNINRETNSVEPLLVVSLRGQDVEKRGRQICVCS